MSDAKSKLRRCASKKLWDMMRGANDTQSIFLRINTFVKEQKEICAFYFLSIDIIMFKINISQLLKNDNIIPRFL